MTGLVFHSAAFDQVKELVEKSPDGIITITPYLAGELFRHHNLHNDMPKLHLLFNYLNEILLGNWRPKVGKTIAFYENGRLADGQHRLMAIYYSKKEVPVWIELNRKELY